MNWTYVTFLYTLVGYSLITSNGLCSHVKGFWPTGCSSGSIPYQSNCESFCTKHTSCIGYTYRIAFQYCYLISSDSSCPSNFLFEQKTHTATTTNDLVGFYAPGYVCYGKNPGKINKLQMSFLYLSFKILEPRKTPLIYAYNNISRWLSKWSAMSFGWILQCM